MRQNDKNVLKLHGRNTRSYLQFQSCLFAKETLRYGLYFLRSIAVFTPKQFKQVCYCMVIFFSNVLCLCNWAEHKCIPSPIDNAVSIEQMILLGPQNEPCFLRPDALNRVRYNEAGWNEKIGLSFAVQVWKSWTLEMQRRLNLFESTNLYMMQVKLNC